MIGDVSIVFRCARRLWCFLCKKVYTVTAFCSGRKLTICYLDKQKSYLDTTHSRQHHCRLETCTWLVLRSDLRRKNSLIRVCVINEKCHLGRPPKLSTLIRISGLGLIKRGYSNKTLDFPWLASLRFSPKTRPLPCGILISSTFRIEISTSQWKGMFYFLSWHGSTYASKPARWGMGKTTFIVLRSTGSPMA